MAFNIPMISIVFALIFLALLFVEIKIKFHGIFALIGLLFNVASVFFLFYYAVELLTILLFLLSETVVVLILIGGGRKDAI